MKPPRLLLLSAMAGLGLPAFPLHAELFSAVAAYAARPETEAPGVVVLTAQDRTPVSVTRSLGKPRTGFGNGEALASAQTDYILQTVGSVSGSSGGSFDINATGLSTVDEHLYFAGQGTAVFRYLWAGSLSVREFGESPYPDLAHAGVRLACDGRDFRIEELAESLPEPRTEFQVELHQRGPWLSALPLADDGTFTYHLSVRVPFHDGQRLDYRCSMVAQTEVGSASASLRLLSVTVEGKGGVTRDLRPVRAGP